MPPTMMLVRRSLRLILAALVMTACVPAARPTPTNPAVDQLAATIVAATMKAVATSVPPTTPLASPVPLTAPAVVPTAKATLFINTDNAACRGGPGPDFKVIANFPAGTSVELAGQDSADNYWIVVDPAFHTQCWVSVQDATPAGDYQTLPQVTPPAVAVTVPGKPSRGAWNFSCDNTNLTTLLAWVPTTGTPNGYRIYREGSQIADVPASQTTYTDKIPFRYGSSITYGVAAYNEAGTSPQAAWNFHCP